MKRGPIGPPGLRLYYVVVDRVEADGTRITGIPVAGACLSLRGAERAQHRVRRRAPDAYLQVRTRIAR